MLLNKQSIKIEGTEGVVRVLESIDKKHARNLLRSTTHAVAARAGKLARIHARQYKDTGLLIVSIKWKRVKSPPNRPVSVVFVQQRAYYWRFVEHGTNGNLAKGLPPLPARPIFGKTVHDMQPQLPRIYAEEFSRKLESKIKRELKKRGV